MVHGLEKAFGERITFVRVNILHPESAALMEQFSFSATPEFYLVDENGEIIGAWDEEVQQDDLRRAFERALDNNRE